MLLQPDGLSWVLPSSCMQVFVQWHFFTLYNLSFSNLTHSYFYKSTLQVLFGTTSIIPWKGLTFHLDPSKLPVLQKVPVSHRNTSPKWPSLKSGHQSWLLPPPLTQLILWIVLSQQYSNFILQFILLCVHSGVAYSLQHHRLHRARLLCPWSGWPFPPPGDLPDPGGEPLSPASPALAGGFFTTALPGKPVTEVQTPPLSPLYFNNL